ncbi:MAG: hypothetical protein M1G31_17010 [Pseudanabaena sp. Salubria-1]|nr:hypothetical protein [Pseudanabaena sp. Salubria-1]
MLHFILELAQHYGLKRLIQLISEAHKKPIDQIREIVIKDVREWEHLN